VARYLADTSAWNRSRLVDRWSEFLEHDELALCAPIRLELLHSARGKADFAELAWQLDGLPSLPTSRPAEALALDVQSELATRSQHRGPKPIDLLIAAVAQVNGAVLLHYDRHFDLIARVTGQPAEWLARRGSLD
jgi:predicted nucleic acid-binding protein